MTSRAAILTASMLALAVAGCQSDRFSGGGGSAMQTRQPEPITAAPSGSVQSSQLPPPSGPMSPSDFPQVPTEGGQDVASLENGGAAPANAPDVSAGSVAGVWNVSVSGQSCRVATPQTKYGQGYRAGPLHCPTPLDGVKSWQVEGKQLAFYDEGGQVVAKLYSSGDSRFDGQTSSGQPVSLSR